MFSDRISDYCFYKNSVHSFEEVDLESFLNCKMIVYEVIRVIEGKPLFWKEHIERIYLSFEKLASKLEIKKEDFEHAAKSIIEKDAMLNNNIKIVIGKFSDHINFLIYNIRSEYPNEETKQKGVKIKPFNYERVNPGAKVINLNYKKEVSNFIKNEGIFEVVLVDKTGNVTEGSRSNIFFIKNDSIYTSKPSEVLLGITRMKLMELFDKLDINVTELEISLDSINDYEGAFLSGTSINALAINSIGDEIYLTSQNTMYNKICKSFEKVVAENIGW